MTFQLKMIIVIFILLFIFDIQSLLVVEGTTTTSSHVFKESIRGLSMRKDLKKTSRASAILHHTVIFAVQQRNLDELEQVLFYVSDPESSNYGKYWSKSQVGELTSNPTSTNAVLEYLSFKKVKVVNQSLYGEYITATATIKVWEDMFNTEFHHFDMKLQSVDGEAKIVQVIRTESYSLPVELSDHVSAVFKTVQFPIRDKFKPEPIEYQPSQSKKLRPTILISLNQDYFRDTSLQHYCSFTTI